MEVLPVLLSVPACEEGGHAGTSDTKNIQHKAVALSGAIRPGQLRSEPPVADTDSMKQQ